MKKKYLVRLFLAIIGVGIFYTLTLGIFIIRISTYFPNDPGSIESTGAFEPVVGFVQYHDTTTIIPQFLYFKEITYPAVYIDYKDNTLRKGYEKYSHIMVQQFEIEFTSGEKQQVIRKDMPIASKEFAICASVENCQQNYVGFIKPHEIGEGKEIVGVYIKGIATKIIGEKEAFTYHQNWKLHRETYIKTGWELVASAG